MRPVGIGFGRPSLYHHSTATEDVSMNTLAATAPEIPRNLWKSTGAVLAGIVVVFVLSMGTDQILHVLGIYPPWGVVMEGTGLYLRALGYRLVFQVIGSYLAGRLAPRNPMRHVWIGA